MITIKSSGLDQISKAFTTQPNNSNDKATSVASSASSGSVDGEPTISDQGKALLSLYASASDYVRGQYMEPYAGRINGVSQPSVFLNIEKYNNYLFEKAAADMISVAEGFGVTLDKSEVLAQLKQNNPDIASIKMNDADRKSKAGPESVMYNLTPSDLDGFTDIYIAAKENGLDLVQVSILALDRGIQNRYGSTLKEGDIYPYDWDFNETDPEKIAAAKNRLPDSIMQKSDEIRSKLPVDLGVANDFIQFLLNPRLGLRGATDDFLDFLSKLIDVYNKPKQPES